MRRLFRFSRTLLLLAAAVWFASTPHALAADCSSVPTRPLDSVSLVHFPIGHDRVEDSLAACRSLPKNAQSVFAQATLLALGGELDAAIRVLRTSNGYLSDAAKLLAADILTERRDPNQARKAIELYQELMTHGSVEAQEGRGVAVLRASREPEDRRRAIEILERLADDGVMSARARLGSALIETAVDEDERRTGLALLESASAQGNIAAKVELAKILIRPGPNWDEERAVALLEPGAAAGAAEAQEMLAALWKNGWDLSPVHAEALRAEAQRNQDYVSKLLQTAQETGDHAEATEAQGSQIRRQQEILELLAEHRNPSKARELFLAAASEGYLPAIVGIGTLLTFHPADTSDFPIGVNYLKQAYARGDVRAAERLAVLNEMEIENLRTDRALEYYKFAAQRGSARAIMALDRLDKPWSELWTREEKALTAFVTGLGLQPSASNSRTFARGLPDDAPFFEANRWVTFTLRGEGGFQIFGSDLNQGDRVRLSPGDWLEVKRLGDLDRTIPLGQIMDKGDMVENILVGEDVFAPVFESFPPSHTSSGSSMLPLPESDLVFRALDGPEDAIFLHDPDYNLLVRSTTFPGMSPYGNASSQLPESVEMRIPNISRVAGVVRGGTEFEIVGRGQSLLKGRVPKGANLYLDFQPNQFFLPLRLALPDTVSSMPSEIERDWIAHPRAALVAGGIPLGWLYAVYDPAPDGLLAAMLEINPPFIAMQAEAQGDFKKSFRLRLVAFHLSLVRHGGLSLESLRTKASLAGPLARLGRLDEAIQLREEVVKSLQTFDVRPPSDLVRQLLELATLYGQQGDLSRAIIAGRQALALATQLSDDQLPALGFPHESVRQAISQLADSYNSAGDFDRTYIYRQRLAAFDLLNDPEETTNGDMETYVSIADLALRQGRRSISLTSARYVLPKVKADAGQRDKPEPIARPVTLPDAMVSVFGPPERSSMVGQALYRLGEAYWAAGSPWSYSEPIYEAANISGLGSTGPGTDLTLRAAARLAMVRWITGKDDRNFELLMRSVGFVDGAGKYPSLEGVDHDTQSLFHSAYLGTLDWYLKNRIVDERRHFDEAASLFVAIERSDPFTRSFEIADIKRHTTNATQAKALKEWIDATAEFDRIIRQLNAIAEGKVARTTNQVDVARERSEAASKRVSAAEAALAIAFPEASMPTNAIELIGALRGKLDSDEVVIDLLPTRYSVYALIITKDSLRLASYAITDIDLVKKISAMRSALEPKRLEVSSPGERIYLAIDTKALLEVRPFTIDLLGEEGRAKKRWIVVSHDVLRNIPLEAVPLSDDVSDRAGDVSRSAELWPGLSKEIAYLPSLSSLLKLRSGAIASRAPNPIAVVADPIMPGDPRYESAFAAGLADVQDWLREVRWSLGNWLSGEGRLQPVPETGALGFEVLNQLGGHIDRLYSGWRARREVISSSNGLQEARVILFATHGETADSYPALAEPFLVLTSSEGSPEPFDPLTASEISSLGLDAELVVLSACDTAAPDGTPGRTGFSGLAQSFMAAGARSLVVTQWAIKTGAARLAVTAMLDAGLRATPSAEALRIGRFEVAKRFGHPSYWSAFAYIGDPAHLWKLRP
ncbi:CHAT domain-containing protein [Mesorhizobium sp.]|uniref:CHAT domain-containing protein n=1 Tax=Mesorhizobium sp. TaxID=1871066 RepID=UPI00257E48D1|nr:CHAT domain-containing protein [Mesorhizobium sp.]